MSQPVMAGTGTGTQKKLGLGPVLSAEQPANLVPGSCVSAAAPSHPTFAATSGARITAVSKAGQLQCVLPLTNHCCQALSPD